MKLFIDTETTGKVRFTLPINNKFQPRIVQLAAILTDDDGKEVASFCSVIRPDGFTIPEEASAIHGISQDFAEKNGIASRIAMLMLEELARGANLLVAHNSDFDKLMVAIEQQRLAMTAPNRSWFCTMKAMTPICKLPGNYSDYKWPKLQEAYKHIHGKGFDGAHDALADVRACMSVYFWLQKKESDEANDSTAAANSAAMDEARRM